MRGFTLVEILVVLALAALLAVTALPAYRGQTQRVARLDAVESLTRIQMAQERYRAANGWYANQLASLGVSGRSPQGLYAIAIVPLGAEAYVARAEALGAQAGDQECSTLTLEVSQGFARNGPSARCWNR